MMPENEPDRYCLTRADGECISTNPRCMHNAKAGYIDERAEFEKSVRIGGVPIKNDTARDINGDYCSPPVQYAWVGWQAARKLSVLDDWQNKAIRQFRHNDGSGFVFAYDKDFIDAMLAAAPQPPELSPVVPDEKTMPDARLFASVDDFIEQCGFIKGWNDCRAAILKGEK